LNEGAILIKKIVLCDNGEYLRVAGWCKKYGLSADVDAFYDPEFGASHPGAIAEHLQAYTGTGIYAMHGPFGDLCFGSFDRLIREATRQRFEYAYEISRMLGCRHIILHHGYVPGTSNPPNWIKRGKVFWDDFLTDKSDDTVFHIENVLEHTPELMAEMVSVVGSPHFDICLDVGHAHCNSKTPVIDWVVQLNEKIGFVHLHNNHGRRDHDRLDEHLGFTKGTLDFEEVCRALEEYAPNAIWGIETNLDEMEESILWLNENGFLKE